ncbi:hypothetical protein GCM10027047_00360 [Rhodococcus aerolatus]
MTVAITLAVSAALVGVLSPRALRSRWVRSWSPTAQLTSWFSSMASMVFFALSAVVVLAWPRHAPAEGVVERLLRCLATATHLVTPWVDESVSVIAGTALTVVLARTVLLVTRQLRSHARTSRTVTETMRLLGRHDATSTDTVWLAHPGALAYSISGPDPLVVVSDGLAQRLEGADLEAVLAHEHAHLTGHHHRLVGLARSLSRALPRVPLLVQAPAAVTTLVELAADRQASRATTTATVRRALLTMRDLPAAAAPGQLEVLLCAATHAVDLRLARLAQQGEPKSARAERRDAATAAGLLALVAPAALACAVVLATTAGGCLVV